MLAILELSRKLWRKIGEINVALFGGQTNKRENALNHGQETINTARKMQEIKTIPTNFVERKSDH